MSRALTCLVVLAVLAPAPSAWVAPEKAAVNLFEDASDFTAQLRKAVPGRVMIDELTLYKDSATLDVQDPRRKENIDRYSYRDGKLKEPEPVKLSGDYSQADLDAGVRWQVGVTDARHTGSVEYDLKGRKKSVFKE